MSLGYRRGLEREGLVCDAESGVQLILDGSLRSDSPLHRTLSQTGSDGQLLLSAYLRWGTEAFSLLEGAWAVAIADHAHGRLVLARDPLGAKPLYYAHAEGRILFASEIRSLLAASVPGLRPDERAIADYLLYGLADHRPETFFAGIVRLPAAHFAVLDDSGLEARCFWNLETVPDAVWDPDGLRERIQDATRSSLSPGTGVHLTEGWPSAVMVAATGPTGERPALPSFAAVTDRAHDAQRMQWNEMAHSLGGSLQTVDVDSNAWVSDLAELVWWLEEPFGDLDPYLRWRALAPASGSVETVLDGAVGQILLEEPRDHTTAAWKRPRGYRRRTLRELLRVSPSDPERPSASRDRLIADIQRFALPVFLRCQDRSAMARSLEIRSPYLDQALVEYLVGLPPEARGPDGRPSDPSASFPDALPAHAGAAHAENRYARTTRWLYARRVVFHSLLRSPSFQSRPYWDGPAVADAFARAAEVGDPDGWVFWRLIHLEVWLRVFFPHGSLQAERPAVSFARLGDAEVSQKSTVAGALLARYQANAGRHLFVVAGTTVYARVPLRSQVVRAGDALEAVVREAVGVDLDPGDTLAISEKVVAISQGRSFPLAEIHPSPLARFLVRFVHTSAHGRGWALPETMELVLRQAGVPRVLLAAGVTMVARPLGFGGVFQRMLGPLVASIDGPSPGTLPPYNTYAKLAPAEPEQVSASLARAFAPGVGVAIVDANDLGARILGASSELDRDLVVRLLVDNPLGQGAQQTPIALIRKIGLLQSLSDPASGAVPPA